MKIARASQEARRKSYKSTLIKILRAYECDMAGEKKITNKKKKWSESLRFVQAMKNGAYIISFWYVIF